MRAEAIGAEGLKRTVVWGKGCLITCDQCEKAPLWEVPDDLDDVAEA